MMEKIGPYRVEEQIGVGGMGEVYKAYDDRLDRWVAIKRIRNDKEQGDENRERFQREARATAKLNHASIVHLYDIFTDGGNDCIVMEFVEGVTLDKLIRNGPLEPVQAASLGHEIASGLAEAHTKGIIHRDLKVENVIVTPQGHAKILDFGLARPLLNSELDASLTGKGQLVGTSRSMSPEYVGGEDIDHRSDLFSLGVLLYEVVTSHSPFKAHNTLATLKQVMLHRQTPAHLVNDNVPEDLSSVIENLLEKDPEDRPQNAREVARDLGQMSGSLSSGDVARPTLVPTFSATPTEVLSPSATSIDIWSRSRGWIVAVLLLVGLAVTYFLAQTWLSAPETPPIQGMDKVEPEVPQKDRIVLADFQNLTGEPLLDNSIAIAFRLGLEQSKHAYVLPQTQIQSVLSRMERDAGTPVDREVGIEIGQRDGARALVIGGIGLVGETYAITAEVVDPRTGVTTFSTQKTANDQDAILTALDAVTEAIRVDLGESEAAIEKARQPLEQVTTRDLQALKAYSLGQERIAEGRNEEAIQLLERALELDPEFAMAHAKLGAVHRALNHDRAKILEHLDQALRRSDRLTEIEKLYVEGWAARMRDDSEAVVRAWTLMSTLHPDIIVAHHNLGMAHFGYFRQYQEAARAFEAAIQVTPSGTPSQATTMLAYCQIALGFEDEAQSILEQGSGIYTDLALADLFLVKRDYPATRAAIDRGLASADRFEQLLTRIRLAELYASRGSLDEVQQEALEVLRIAVAEGREELSLAAQLAVITAQEHIGPRDALDASLAAATHSAVELLDTYRDKSGPAPIPLLALVGKLNARNQQLENAERIYSRIAAVAEGVSLSLWQSHRMLLEGELMMARNQTEEALVRFKTASDLSESFQLRESLARAYQTAGLINPAIAEYEWLIEHRGQGLVECLHQCPTVSTIDWALAFKALGQLYEQRGDRDAAISFYSRFLEQWPEGGDLEIVQEAQQRLEALS